MKKEEIIKVLKDNRWVAFGGLPEECRKFLLDATNRKLSDVERLVPCGDFHPMHANKIKLHRVYRLKPSFELPEKKEAGYVEYPVTKEANGWSVKIGVLTYRLSDMPNRIGFGGVKFRYVTGDETNWRTELIFIDQYNHAPATPYKIRIWEKA